MKKIALIGSTGSIGTQVLNVVRANPDKFKIVSLSAGNNTKLFCSQVEEFLPKVATISTKLDKEYIQPKGVEIFQGNENAFLNAIIDEADIVVISVVGFLGLTAVMKALEKNKDIALANKESLVVGGELVISEAKRRGLKILPIDSEHSAIWQALDFDFNKPFKNLILTASGGAFRDFSNQELERVRAVDALKHPTWNMGAKITIDCATLVNKAFEVAEAHWLYNASFEKIKVIIHRESIIHSMVEYQDNSVIAQMSYPSMELPIQVALTYPERFNSSVKSLNFSEIGKLTFSSVDEQKYPCFNLSVNALKKGGRYPAVLNGANERAVMAFLSEEIAYKDIYKMIDGALNSFKQDGDISLEGLIEANMFGRKFVESNIGK